MTKIQKRTIKKLKDSTKPEVQELANELDAVSALDALHVSDGGKVLIEALTKDIVSIIDTLTIKYKTTSHLELIAHCADLKAQLDILHTLTRARKNKEDLTDVIMEALKE